MYKLSFFILLLLFSCKHTTEKPVATPLTDHTVTPDTTSQEQKVNEKDYTLYLADTSNLTPEPATPIKLLLEGSFHKQEVWQGAEKHPWLAVFNDNGHYYLREAKLTVKPAYDPVVDNGSEITGRRIISGREVISQDSNAVFFLSKFFGSSLGMLDTVSFARGIIPVNRKLNFKFKGKPYQIEAFGDSIQQSNTAFSYRNYGWKLSGSKKGKYIVQTLAEDAQLTDSIYILLWAGDLDRDGIPDLLIDTSNHYNVSTIVLFMSAKAKKGKLYEKVAVFETTGC